VFFYVVIGSILENMVKTFSVAMLLMSVELFGSIYSIVMGKVSC
jgi:hypothetical protein